MDDHVLAFCVDHILDLTWNHTEQQISWAVRHKVDHNVRMLSRRQIWSELRGHVQDHIYLEFDTP